MIVGLHDPTVITPFDHGIQMDPDHPYSYIRALYNMFVCVVAAVLVTITTTQQNKLLNHLKAKIMERYQFIFYL